VQHARRHQSAIVERVGAMLQPWDTRAEVHALAVEAPEGFRLLAAARECDRRRQERDLETCVAPYFPVIREARSFRGPG
jgi:hypothetical protein